MIWVRGMEVYDYDYVYDRLFCKYLLIICKVLSVVLGIEDINGRGFCFYGV